MEETKTEVTEETKQNSKFQSRRFILCVWCALAVTGIIVGSFIRNNYEFIPLSITLAGVIGAFIGLESYNKKFKYQNDNKE